MGKTSQASCLNVPGKIGWIIMETPGPVLLLYTMLTLPAEMGLDSLPWENWFLASIFVRALPFFPSENPLGITPPRFPQLTNLTDNALHLPRPPLPTP